MPGLSEVKWHLGRRLRRWLEQSQRQSFLAVQDGPTRFAYGHGGLHALTAAGTLRRFSYVVIPFLVEAQVPRRAPLQVVDEQKRVRTLPLAVRCRDHGAIELLEPRARATKF